LVEQQLDRRIALNNKKTARVSANGLKDCGRFQCT
jgi:hypothetical protein